MNEFEEKDYAGARSYADGVQKNAAHIYNVTAANEEADAAASQTIANI